MKVPQHTILNAVELKVVASSELEEEVQEELKSAKAEKKMTDVLKANKAFGSTLPKSCCKGKKNCEG